jgi:hypothetical protein
MTWKEFIYREIIEYCNRKESRTFSLKDFYNDKENVISGFKPKNLHRLAKVRQQLQFLRNDGLLTFLDNSGHYTLRGINLLEKEKEETFSIDISKEIPEKREYLVETYVRNVGWAKRAKETFGFYCMFPSCNNTFIKEDGTPYIEVHHIIPLCSGGEDGLWNLSVLCAHHHRVAHFAELKTRFELEKTLLQEVKFRM